ncbi:hypothetical protein KP509_03G049800 [Ceratopteris richardii]|uniref:Uncharacterized protein n=1 Tax=Ceratopteris richardii TaxID=49495 RepID=A0A8T2V2T2_CERRI|nr:hypothetical protein KP509_03G049800 [Ceratopteris richardii]
MLPKSFEEDDVFVEYSMERFEHRISGHHSIRPSTGNGLVIENREDDCAIPPFRGAPISRRCSVTRMNSNRSSFSGSSSGPPSSPESSSGSDDGNGVVPKSPVMRNQRPPNINNNLFNTLATLQDDNVSLQQQIRNIRASQLDSVVVAMSNPVSHSLHNMATNFTQTSTENLHSNHSSNILGNIDMKLFDPLSITLFTEEELHPEGTDRPDIHILGRDVDAFSDDKRILLQEKHSLEKGEYALETALTKARREIEDAAVSVIGRLSPSKGHHAVSTSDSDVQRLCNLSRLLADENEHLRAQLHENEAEVRIAKADLGEMKTQNSQLMMELSSTRAEKVMLEEELEILREREEKSAEEAEKERARILKDLEEARTTTKQMQEEKNQLISEKARLEKEMWSVLESLQEFKERQTESAGENQTSGNQLELDISNAMDCPSRKAEACQGRRDGAETSILEPQEQAADLRLQLQLLAQELDIERAGRRAALEDMALIRLRERTLVQDIKHLLEREHATEQQDLQVAPSGGSTSSQTATVTVPTLESQLSQWLRERANLQDADKEHQQQIEKLAKGLSQSLQDMQDELLHWKNITSQLEQALNQARERNVIFHQGFSYLHPNSPGPVRSTLHAAAASGALAGFGLLAYAKLRNLSSS